MNRNIEKKKIFVTGGSGLVGSAIYHLSERYEEYEFIFISSRDVDLERYEEIDEYFCNHKIDVILHLAAYVGGLYKNMNEKVNMFEKNMRINMNVLRAAHMNGIQKIISCLSTCIFPDKTEYPINEQMLHDGPPHHSNDGYAYSKRMLDILSKSYRENYGRDYICVIPTNIYGKYDNYHLEDGHVIPALIHKCYLHKMNDEDFMVKGSGRALRQFIYSEDLAYIMIWMIDNYKENDNLIISVDESDEVTIGEIAYMIADEYDYSDRVRFEINGIDGQYKKTADNRKLRFYLGDYQFKNIREGIKESVQWFQENYPHVRK